MKNFKNILWGLVIVAFGVLWGLHTAGILKDILFDGWWTLFIIVPAIIGLITDKNKTFSVIMLIVGGVLLASQYVDFHKVRGYIIPAVIIVIGISVAFGGIATKNHISGTRETVTDGSAYGEYSAFCSKQELVFPSDFNGGKFSALFGGIKIDLTSATIKSDVTINTSAVFGGIDIYVPRYVRVVTNTSSVFGGITDKTSKTVPAGAVTVYVNSQNVFGGTEIKYI